MKEITLTKKLDVPENIEEYEKEPTVNRDERWLRYLLKHGFEPIFIGDEVKVSERYVYGRGDEHPHTGKVGEVTGIYTPLKSKFHIYYMDYSIKNKNGETFEIPYHRLDRIKQTKSNEILEKILKETNFEFEPQT